MVTVDSCNNGKALQHYLIIIHSYGMNDNLAMYAIMLTVDFTTHVTIAPVTEN